MNEPDRLGPHWLAEEAPWNETEVHYDDDQTEPRKSRWASYTAPWQDRGGQ